MKRLTTKEIADEFHDTVAEPTPGAPVLPEEPKDKSIPRFVSEDFHDR